MCFGHDDHDHATDIDDDPAANADGTVQQQSADTGDTQQSGPFGELTDGVTVYGAQGDDPDRTPADPTVGQRFEDRSDEDFDEAAVERPDTGNFMPTGRGTGAWR